jgi:hypothetical protein
MAKRSERRIPCVLHIPGCYPDGSEVEPAKMEKFLQMLDRQFGGSTPLGIVPGRWVDEDKTVEEPMHRYEVAVKEKDLGTFEKIARLIGKETKQKAVYIVINFQSEARFLFVDDEEQSPPPPEGDEDDEDQSPPKVVNE